MTRYRYHEKTLVPGAESDDLPRNYREHGLIPGSEGVVIPNNAEFVDVKYDTESSSLDVRVRYLEPIEKDNDSADGSNEELVDVEDISPSSGASRSHF